MSMTKSSWLAYILMIGLLLLFWGCVEARNNNSYTPLPDIHWEVSKAEVERALLESALRICERGAKGDEPIEQLLPDKILIRSQYETALHLLKNAKNIESLQPLTVYAGTGFTTDGDSIFVVEVLNPNRETSKVHMRILGPNREYVKVLIDIPLEIKWIEYVWGFRFKTEPMTWGSYGPDKKSIVFRANNGDTIPFPDIDQYPAYVAVEDRAGRMSNFVPVYSWGARSP